MKKAFTLVEALVVLGIIITLILLVLGIADRVTSTSIEPVEKIVTKLHYEPSHTTLESNYNPITKRIETTTIVHPEEYTVICGYGESITFSATEKEWKELKVNDKVIVYFKRGGITKTKYVSGWVLSRKVSPELKP
jgi:competence protein ComGC